MRNIITLYLAYNRNAEYHRGWTQIAYVLAALFTTEEEESFIIFAYLVETIKVKLKETLLICRISTITLKTFSPK
jgi:TBC domain.